MRKIFLRTLLIGYLVLVKSNIYAIETKRLTNGDLVLVGNSCQELKDVLTNICQWNNHYSNSRINISDVVAKEKCLKNQNRYSINIKNCAPEFTLNYHEKKLINEGPNCWGTAMSFQHYTIKPRFMWPEEMNYWMQSPLCKEVLKNEQAKPGDIINVYAPDYIFEEEIAVTDAGMELTKILTPDLYLPIHKSGYTGFDRLLHSAIYIHPKLSFGKNSPDKADRFFYHPPSEIYGRPPKGEEECQENSDIQINFRKVGNPTKHHRRKCAYFTKVYRCENFTHYFQNLKVTGKNKDYLDTVKALSSIQADLFPLLTSNVRSLQKCEYDLLKVQIHSIVAEAKKELKKKPLSKEDEMILVYLYFTAEGLTQTLSQFKLFK